MGDEASSRERLIDAALALFAAKGFEATTVGDVEGAAGFTPRGGTMYKHFSSKEELLQAALDHHVLITSSLRSLVDLLPLGDVGAETTLWVRYLLAELERHRDVTTLIEKEGGRSPVIADRFWDEIAQPGYQLGVDLFGKEILESRQEPWDLDALSVVLLGAVVNYRRAQWTFGHAPLDVSEERLERVIRRLMELVATGEDGGEAA